MIMKKTIILLSGLLSCLIVSAREIPDSLVAVSADTLEVTEMKEEGKNKRKNLRKLKSEADIIIEDTLTNEFLDSLDLKKKLDINDYSLIGVQYGVGLSQVMWNPTQKQDMLLMPLNVGITFTKYGKMFGYMPYFGFQAGIFYGKEGYQFKYNEDKDYTYTIEGAEKAVIEMVEIPVLAHMHIDFWKMKLIANIGCYAGYRLSIERFAGKDGHVSNKVAHSFLDTDRRLDYGIKGGVGIGFIFDPVEIHIQGMYKHSFSSLYEPDYHSKYFYRYAYPSNIIISAGVHFQLTKRTGKTKSQLKKEARQLVYGVDESNGR